MNEFRLIASIVLLYVMLLMEYPLPTIVTSIVLIIAFLIIRFAPNLNSTSINYPMGSQRGSRIAAIEAASMYLAPYSDIWRDLRLSNKFCSVKLGHDGERIIVTEKTSIKNAPYRTFRIVRADLSMQEVWNAICLNFDHQSTYDNIMSQCIILLNAQVSESTVGNTYASKTAINSYETATHSYEKPKENVISPNISPKVDINNASEIELTALPGISIVMSKRIIKKREEIRGFKTLNDFFLFIKVKPHMEEQLRNLICIEKMKGSLKIERFQERKLDL